MAQTSSGTQLRKNANAMLTLFNGIINADNALPRHFQINSKQAVSVQA